MHGTVLCGALWKPIVADWVSGLQAPNGRASQFAIIAGSQFPRGTFRIAEWVLGASSSVGNTPDWSEGDAAMEW